MAAPMLSYRSNCFWCVKNSLRVTSAQAVLIIGYSLQKSSSPN